MSTDALRKIADESANVIEVSRLEPRELFWSEPKRTPSNPEVLLAVAKEAEGRGDLESAVNFLRKAAMRNSGADGVYFFLGVALWNKNGPGRCACR